LLESGSAVHTVSGVLGHANTKTTDAYLSSTVEQHRAALAQRDKHRANGFRTGFAQPAFDPARTRRLRGRRDSR